MDFNQIEQKILEFWKKEKIFGKSLEKNKSKKSFVFFEGPPTANGMPGMHHVEARAFKDVIPRYKTMRGFFVGRKAGWDTHGLPVELQVEKELGLKNKKEVEKYGIGKFNQKCKESVWKYKDEWEKLTERIGYWLDMENPYITYENYYIESLWFILKKVFDKGLMYKGFKVVPHCPRCVTTLSSHEVAQGYKTVKENSIYVKFKVEEKIHPSPPLEKEGEVFFLVWTTTPWTLPANVGLAVGEKINYVKAKIGGKIFILAKDRLEAINSEYEIIEEIKGKNLIGLKYEPLFKNPNQKETDLKVVAGDFISTEDGTGIVHLAPAYGEDDLRAGRKENLSVIHTVASDGIILRGLGIPGEGKFIKQADKDIIEDLRKRDLLFKEENYEHEYPFCWRCDSPLLYYAKDSWFIKMSNLREKLVLNNKKINWEPAYIKDGRFGEFIKEAKDWAISRERFWGTPLPIWTCGKCGKTESIGSIKELGAKTIHSGNKFFLMRHGEAESNAKRTINSDIRDNHINITSKGKKDVLKTAKKLKRVKIDLIFASDFLRTKQTAEIVAEEIGLGKDNIIYDNRLHELNVGIFHNQHIEEYRKYFTRPIERFEKAPPDGENLRQLKKRGVDFLLEIDKKFKSKNILIVGHLDPIWMMVVGAKGQANTEAVTEYEKKKFLNTGDFITLNFSPLPHDENYVLDLHRPFVDEIKLKCKCGGEMEHVKEVIDVWFDSGAMPFAQWGYPHKKGSDKGFKNNYPADYISEAIDQTRGWFYTLLAVATLMEECKVISAKGGSASGGKNGAPYKNVICLGHVLDKHGKKMSKSRGNVVDPWEMCEKFGADTLRWYLYTVNSAGDPKKFDVKDVQDKNRRVFGTLLNSLVFFQTYVDKDFKPAKIKTKNILDKWIISKFNSLTEQAINHLEKYDVVSAARLIEDFVDDLSNWFIRRSRERFQRPESLEEKEEAAQTLYFVLVELSKLIAPFAPFISEYIYSKLVQSPSTTSVGSGRGYAESVHLCDYPKPNKKLVDKRLEDSMKIVREIVAKGLALRMEKKIKIRQPLAELGIRNQELGKNKELMELIKDELNVKKIAVNKSQKEDIILDTEITPELKEEGLARELVRQIQQMRKEAGFVPQDVISIMYQVLSIKYKEFFQKWGDFIQKETNANDLEEHKGEEKFDLEKEIDFWGGVIKIMIRKVS